MNIYVGNLPFTTTDADLRAAFDAYGKVSSASVIIDRETGRSRGFGFVEMASNDQARAAIQALDGTDLGGRALKVNLARPREASKAKPHAEDRLGRGGGALKVNEARPRTDRRDGPGGGDKKRGKVRVPWVYSRAERTW